MLPKHTTFRMNVQMLPKHTTFKMNSVTNGKRKVFLQAYPILSKHLHHDLWTSMAPPWTSMLPASSLAKPPLCLAGTSTVVTNNTGVQDTINRFGEATLRLVMQRHDRSFLLCQAYPYAWLAYPYAWLRHLDSGHCLSVQRHERSIVLAKPYAWLLGTKPTLSLVIRHFDSGH
jgi:hypothetical protein